MAAPQSLHQVLDRLHANQPDAHLTVIGNDLPSNNWLWPRTGPADPGTQTTVLVSARNFYEPSVAPNTVSFGFSATAMHWLGESPGPLDTYHVASAC